MADSKRQLLTDLVLARMRLIKVASGYETDIGHNVYEWRDFEAEPWQDGEPEALSVRDKEELAEDGLVQQHSHDKDLEFELEFRTTIGSGDVAKRARKIIADIEKAIGVDKFWSTKARGTTPLSVNQMDVVKGGKVYAGALLKFRIKYRVAAFNPYSP